MTTQNENLIERYTYEKHLGRGYYKTMLRNTPTFSSIEELKKFIEPLGIALVQSSTRYWKISTETVYSDNGSDGFRGSNNHNFEQIKRELVECDILRLSRKGNFESYVVHSNYNFSEIYISISSEREEQKSKQYTSSNKLINFINKNKMQTLDISLNNAALYEGCQIEEVAGRLNLTTSISDAVNIVGRNVAAMDLKGDEITLTGAMAVWSYLIVFHAVVHRFRRVYYDDGRSETILVAAHG